MTERIFLMRVSEDPTVEKMSEELWEKTQSMKDQEIFLTKKLGQLRKDYEEATKHYFLTIAPILKEKNLIPESYDALQGHPEIELHLSRPDKSLYKAPAGCDNPLHALLRGLKR